MSPWLERSRSAAEIDDVQVERELSLARRGRGGEVALEVAAQIVGYGRVRNLAGEREPVDYIRDPFGPEDRWAVHDVEVQVRGGWVAGVADLPQHLSAPDVITRTDRNRSLAQMRVERVPSAAEIEHDVVAIDVVDVDGGGVRILAWHLIIEGIERLDHRSIRDGEHLVVVGGIAVHVGRVAVQEPALLIELHPIDGEALGEMQLPVDRHRRGAMRHAGGTATVERHPV